VPRPEDLETGSGEKTQPPDPTSTGRRRPGALDRAVWMERVPWTEVLEEGGLASVRTGGSYHLRAAHSTMTSMLSVPRATVVW
jgi:hypothetical protein